MAGAVDDTVSVTVQELFPDTEPPDRLRLPPLKLTVPPQVVCWFEPFNPAGSGLAATATPVSATALGLLIVSVSVDVCEVVTEVGENAAAMFGPVSVETFSAVGVVAAEPLGALDAETAPVV